MLYLIKNNENLNNFSFRERRGEEREERGKEEKEMEKEKEKEKEKKEERERREERKERKEGKGEGRRKGKGGVHVDHFIAFTAQVCLALCAVSTPCSKGKRGKEGRGEEITAKKGEEKRRRL